jgi:segregation and condensation protein A
MVGQAMTSETQAELSTDPAFALQLDVFEGPLDLLLHLIDREEMDITAISLVQVTDQYLAYIRAGDQIDARALAEFIAIGARLLLMKSRALLPRPRLDEEGEEDVGDDLVRRLLEYRRFKEVAAGLREIEEEGLRAYPRQAPPTGIPLPTGLDGTTLDRLMSIFQEVLARKPDEEPIEQGEVERHEVTVEQKTEQLSRKLEREKRVSFRSFISDCGTRMEVIVSFFAVLELIKAIKLEAEQDASFGDIQLVAVTPAPID